MCSRCRCLADPAAGARVRPAIVEGALEAAVLLLLAEGSGYGYELAAATERRALVPGRVTPARVYEVLRRLEDEGAVTSRGEGSPEGPDRRRYRLARRGRARLDGWAEALRLTEQALQRLLHAHAHVRGVPHGHPGEVTASRGASARTGRAPAPPRPAARTARSGT